MTVEIRLAHASLAPRLTEIAHAAKRHWGYADSELRKWREELTITRETIERLDVFVALDQGHALGFSALGGEGARLSIEHLWVDPPSIGRGLGRALFSRAVACARERGAHEIEILSDPNAEGFYLRLGARRAGETPAPVAGDAGRVLPRLLLELGSSRSLDSPACDSST